MSFPAYETYKDSGAAWLGELPGHWQIEKIKHLATLAGEKVDGSGSAANYVGLEHVQSGTGQFVVSFEGMQTEAESTVNTFKTGDVLFGKLRPYLAKAVVADTDGICSSEFLVLRPVSVDPNYLKFCLLFEGFIRTVDASTFGSKMPRADWTFISQLRLPKPPTDEQQAIADYLDTETARIDALIREKDGLVRLLGEYRQSVISEVLSGEHLSGSYSGCDWVPHLPTGWVLKRLKHLGNVRSGIAKGKDNTGEVTIEIPYLRVANVQDGHLDLETISTIPVVEADVARYLLQPGDVLMNEGGDYDKVGRGAVWNGEVSPCIHQNHVFAVRPVEDGLSEWISASTQTKYAKFYFMNNAKQSTNLASISQSNIKELPLLLPPALQRESLLAEVRDQTARIDDLITHAKAEITLLKELRAATIADAVLGRVDVRPHEATPAKRQARKPHASTDSHRNRL